MGRGVGQTQASFRSVLGERRFGSKINSQARAGEQGPVSVRPFLTRELFKKMTRSTAAWPRVAKQFGITPTQLEQMQTAARRYPSADNHVYKQCLELLYPVGTRVRLDDVMNTGDPPLKNVPEPGEYGAITGYDDAPKFDVDWQNGSHIALLVTDAFSVIAD